MLWNILDELKEYLKASNIFVDGGRWTMEVGYIQAASMNPQFNKSH